MAKQTRAQRKKNTERRLRNEQVGKATVRTDLVEDATADDSATVSSVEKAEDTSVTGIDANSAATVQDKAAEKAQKRVEKAEARQMSKAEARDAKRDEKNRQKYIERERKASKRAEKKSKKAKRRGPKFVWTFIDYIRNVRIELKRVTWPTRAEVGRMSLVVIVALVFFGLLIYIVDSAVTPLLYWYSTV